MNGELMSAEIREQPEVLRRILRDGMPAIRDAARAIKERNPGFVIFVARGTSDHAALYAKYLVETLLRLPAGLASPSTITTYDTHPRFEGGLCIGVSQSGSSPDLVEPLERARAGGAITLAVTNAPESPLARAAELSIDVLAGPERAVAATKTYTAELFTLYLLIEALAGMEHRADGLAGQAERVLELDDRIADIAVRYRFADQLIITSRGYNYPTALETALKLMETSYIVAHGFSGADLLHGPMAMIDRGFPVIAIVPGGKGGVALRPVLARLSELGADTFAAGAEEMFGSATVSLPIPGMSPEILSPIPAIMAMQLFALHVALLRGVDPDQPRAITKVTETW